MAAIGRTTIVAVAVALLPLTAAAQTVTMSAPTSMEVCGVTIANTPPRQPNPAFPTRI